MKSDRRYIEIWPDSNIHAECGTRRHARNFSPLHCRSLHSTSFKSHTYPWFLNSHSSDPKCQIITGYPGASGCVSQCVSVLCLRSSPHDTGDKAHNGQCSVVRAAARIQSMDSWYPCEKFDTIVTSPVGKMSSADWVMMSRHKFYRVIESLLVTNLTNNLLSFIACSGALDSLTVTSVIVFPILQLGNKHEDTFRKINSHIESSASALCKDTRLKAPSRVLLPSLSNLLSTFTYVGVGLFKR